MSDDEEDIPFMNYRVWQCDVCKKTVELQAYENQAVPEKCCHCEAIGKISAFITGGYKGCMLIWNEERVV